MRNKKIVVLGGSGFIGREIVKNLVKEKADVIVGCRNIKKAGFLEQIKGNGRVTVVQTDVTVQEDVRDILQGSDIVISLVGVLYEIGKYTFNTIQAEVPKMIGVEANKAGVERILHFSALGADKTSQSEYAVSKAMGEETLLSVFPATTIFRPSIVFGPNDNFFNKFSNMAAFSPVLPLIGRGETLFQPIYVKDISNAVLKVFESTQTAGKTYELGGPSTYSFKELIELTMLYSKRSRLLLNLPFWLANIQATFMELLPNPILTRDQLELLKVDNVVRNEMHTLADLNIIPTACESILPTYLDASFKSTS
ncbi:MAG: complex I NDUFA9 subunit family protein [Rhodospirillaceae bacterium]|nr:complex I NDUFA9 subunit family protein [Rhodospirillaceae bacterium]MBT5911475.1 complex I NDUFA9 subunit family protein [Rhodospirillaceae bacterium]MBT6306411.1 complex I NDUFA9 subunit family protein [Rhodospirillaceae bacterium]MDC0999348.1 complex I NDUFA9 subunit family protein [Alphaproteobacteria bacterium]MDC1442813.1 complex I NDUFA9 subunit family protein [Rhodospirillaceae bacterium]